MDSQPNPEKAAAIERWLIGHLPGFRVESHHFDREATVFRAVEDKQSGRVLEIEISDEALSDRPTELILDAFALAKLMDRATPRPVKRFVYTRDGQLRLP